MTPPRGCQSRAAVQSPASARQTAAGPGAKASEAAITEQNSAASACTRREGGTSRVRAGDEAREMREVRFVGRGIPEQVVGQLGVGQVEKPRERPLFLRGGLLVTLPGEALEQHIQLLHAAAAAPEEPLRLVRVGHQCCLSSIFFLSSAIARAGFRSFGQASVQFMIVWQRYRRNGSSSSSRRSPVASSRVSTIHRYAASNAAGP